MSLLQSFASPKSATFGQNLVKDNKNKSLSGDVKYKRDGD